MAANSWEVRSLGDLTDNYDSIRVPVREADRRQGSYPYYGASGIVDHVDQYLFDGEYLLVAEDGENLRTRNTPVAFLARGKFWVNNHAHIVRANSEADTRFLMYALARTDISGYLTGSTMPKLTQGNLNRIPILTPPLSEQRAIAHILGTLDDKIELNWRMNETLEAIARALFKSWFVDFDPVRARAEGRDTGLPAHIAALFPDSFEESELGEIPKGWRVGAFQAVASLVRETVNPLLTPEAEFLHFSIPAYDQGRAPKHERGDAIRSQKFRVPPGAVLVSKLNPEIERVWLAEVESRERAICSTEFLVLTGRKPFTSPFIYCLSRSVAFRRGLEGLVTGTSKSHQRAQPEAILRIHTVLPAAEVLTSFEEHVAPVLRATQVKKSESRTLAALRDTLLPKLISGELRVPDAERALADVPTHAGAAD